MKKIVRLTESDLTRIVKKVIKEQRGDIPKDVKLAKRRRGIKLSGNELYQHIKDPYVDQIEDEANIDDFSDDYEYYDNIIGWAVEKYIEAEEPEREDDWAYRDELADNLKDYWMPI